MHKIIFTLALVFSLTACSDTKNEEWRKESEAFLKVPARSAKTENVEQNVQMNGFIENTYDELIFQFTYDKSVSSVENIFSLNAANLGYQVECHPFDNTALVKNNPNDSSFVELNSYDRECLFTHKGKRMKGEARIKKEKTGETRVFGIIGTE